APPSMPAIGERFEPNSQNVIDPSNGSSAQGNYWLSSDANVPDMGGPKAQGVCKDMRFQTDDSSQKPTLVLQRLAHPHRMPNADPNSPDFNPFVTVDYMEGVPMVKKNGQILQSIGRRQPYCSSTMAQQFSFTSKNANDKTPSPWIVHMDRPLVS